MQVMVVGCGVVGAAIAYELSQMMGQIPNLTVTVVDRGQPAQACTGAALGVLMGAISTKAKGNHLRMRLASIQRYNDWIPELERMTGRRIPFNRQGILRLCFAGEDLAGWRSLAKIRQAQGWTLEVWDPCQLVDSYPYLNLEPVLESATKPMIGAVYSPQDRQVDPTALTLALVEAAQQNGVTFQFNTPVTAPFVADWVVIAAGLGSTSLTKALQQPVELRPVLGQAMQVHLDPPLGNAAQPVITGHDVHIVPLEGGDYWIGATVEFPQAGAGEWGTTGTPQPLVPNPNLLEQVRQQAIAICPDLAHATLQRTWYGLRPRPEGRPAPIIERLSGDRNVILATGHYRNGVLLAPATAQKVAEIIKAG